MNPAAAALSTTAAFRAFILAGNAIFTIVSKKTGARKTFRVQAKKGATDFWFVSLLVGPSNTEDYKYLGALWVKGNKTAAADFGDHPALGWKQNKQGWGEDASVAFAWIVRNLNGETDGEIFDHAEVYHEGRCGRCGRTLTTPESVATGLGPVCAGRGAGEE
jgi:hypothetical protein